MMFHARTMVVDGVFATIVEDLAQSRPYTYSRWRDRLWKERLMEWLILPFRGEL